MNVFERLRIRRNEFWGQNSLRGEEIVKPAFHRTIGNTVFLLNTYDFECKFFF